MPGATKKTIRDLPILTKNLRCSQLLMIFFRLKLTPSYFETLGDNAGLPASTP